MPTSMKRIIVIAGPNGAGKTTFATEFLPREAACPRFINADLIAAGLSPFNPEHRGHPSRALDAFRNAPLSAGRREFCLRDHTERAPLRTANSQVAVRGISG